MRRRIRLGLVAAGALVLLLAGCADRHDECIRGVFAEDIAIKKKWQEDLRGMVIEGNPALEVPATASRDLQVALLEKREREFQFLMKNHPKNIEARGGIAMFRDYSWTDELAAELRGKSPEYGVLEERIRELRERNRDLPDWEAYRDYFQSTLVNMPGFRGLAGEIARREKANEDRFAECREMLKR